jgi:manganese/iron transport system permease protein
MLLLASLFGVVSCFIGLAASYFLDIPSGASIVITSCVIFGVAAAFSPKRKVKRWQRS